MRIRFKTTGTLGMWSIIAFFLLAVVGWVMNLIAVIGLATAGDPVSALLLVRLVGVFLAPFGALFGWVL